VGAVKPPVQSDVFVRVFVNMPDATPDTPIEDPHYAGSFAFFESDHDEKHGSEQRQFIVDLTETVRRLRPKGAFRDSSQVDVQLVAVPFPDREPKAAKVRVERLMLGISAPLQLE
jgi:tyrosinase